MAHVGVSPADARTATQERGSVSPPWFRYRDCTGVRQLTAGSLPRLRQRALSSFPEPRRADEHRSRRKRTPLQLRYSHPRRADARRSCLCTRRVSANVCGIGVAGAFVEPRRADERRSRRKRTLLQLQYVRPRRADARRSLLMCVCASQKLFFSPAHVRTRKTRAGGVSPPWFRYRDCTGVRQLAAGSLPRLCQSSFASPLARTTAG
jgi:hypothetical protein